MSWIDFDEVTVIQKNTWYYADRVPGSLFRIERTDGAPLIRPEKLIVRRWRFDENGDRLFFGDGRSIWVPPDKVAIRLSSDDPDLDTNAGVAFYLSRRYNAFGIYRVSVWDSPKDMRFTAIVKKDDLDSKGDIEIVHNLGSELVSTSVFYSLRGRLTKVLPDQEYLVNENTVGFRFKSYKDFAGFFKILIERR